MSGWEQTHRRYNLVYAVAEDIARRGAQAREKWQPMIDAEFGSLDAFLLDVRRRWFNAVDAHSEDGGMSEIQRTVTRGNRPLRVLLDAFADHPVIASMRGLRTVHTASA